MSEEVWKQEYVHVFLLYNVRRNVETGVCTCIPPVCQKKCGNRSMYMYFSCIMSEEVWKQEYVHVFLLYNVRRSSISRVLGSKDTVIQV
jgi:hypothetical protein